MLTVSAKGCAKRVVQAIEFWNSKHNPGERLCVSFQSEMDKLLDLKPKSAGRKRLERVENELQDYRSLMQKTVKKKRKTSGSNSDDSGLVNITTST